MAEVINIQQGIFQNTWKQNVSYEESAAMAIEAI